MKKILLVCVLAAAACGGGKKASTKPTTPPMTEPEKVAPPHTEDGDDGSAKTPEDGDEGGAKGGGAKRKLTPEEEKEALALVQQTADQICACKDMACAQKVIEDVTPKLQKYDNTEPSPEVERQAEAIGKRMADCMQKLAPAEQPGGGDKK